MAKESITTPISEDKNNIYTVNRAYKSQATNKTVDKPTRDKLTKLNKYINKGLHRELTHKHSW